MAIINQEKLLAQLQSDLELLEQLRELFLEECAELLEFLRQAFATQDTDKVSSVLHKLKGVLANFMIETPRESLTRVANVNAADPEAVEAVLANLRTELELMNDELIEIVRNSSP